MDATPGRWRRAIASASASVAALFGLGLVLVAFVVGDCASFGGRCPAERPPLLEDDAFGMAAFGAFTATAIPLVLLVKRDRRFVRAVVIGVAAALVVGLLARSATSR